MSCDHFGTCPECGKSDGCLNVGRTHFFVCHAHRTRWNVGDNLFSGWRDESPDLHRDNAALLEGYREVEPRPPRGLVRRRLRVAVVRRLRAAWTSVRPWVSGLR